MKRFKSYCSCSICPVETCERHHTHNRDNEISYDFRGTCGDYSKYLKEYFRKKIGEGVTSPKKYYEEK